MHEYGIIQDLLLKVDEQVRSHRGRRAVRIVLAVDGGHVDEGFIRDAFDTFKVATTASDAELLVEQAPGELWCPGCGTRATPAGGDSSCPRCGAAAIRMASKDEIFLQSVEIEV